MSHQEIYMLLSVIGELGIGTYSRPVTAARLIIPKETLRDAGYKDWAKE